MLFTSIVNVETIFVVLSLLGLAWGLARITTRRQTEILKDYLQSENLRVEQLILHPGKTLSDHDENEPLSNSQDTP